MPRIMTICPSTGHPVATHAVMAEAKFNRLRTGLAFYCSACEQSHLVERRALHLESGEAGPHPSLPRSRDTRSGVAAE
jgi:hypothetical protein